MSLFQLLHHTVLRDMNPADLAKIVCIEQRVNACPWSCGNFTDALKSNYVCKVYEAEGEILGYVVIMLAVDEAHLLNIALSPNINARGWAVGYWVQQWKLHAVVTCSACYWKCAFPTRRRWDYIVMSGFAKLASAVAITRQTMGVKTQS